MPTYILVSICQELSAYLVLLFSLYGEYLKSHKDLVIPTPLLLNKTSLENEGEGVLGSEGRFIASVIDV